MEISSEKPIPRNTRKALESIEEQMTARGYECVESSPNGYRRYVNHDSHTFNAGNAVFLVEIRPVSEGRFAFSCTYDFFPTGASFAKERKYEFASRPLLISDVRTLLREDLKTMEELKMSNNPTEVVRTVTSLQTDLLQLGFAEITLPDGLRFVRHELVMDEEEEVFRCTTNVQIFLNAKTNLFRLELDQSLAEHDVATGQDTNLPERTKKRRFHDIRAVDVRLLTMAFLDEENSGYRPFGEREDEEKAA